LRHLQVNQLIDNLEEYKSLFEAYVASLTHQNLVPLLAIDQKARKWCEVPIEVLHRQLSRNKDEVPRARELLNLVREQLIVNEEAATRNLHTGVPAEARRCVELEQVAKLPPINSQNGFNPLRKHFTFSKILHTLLLESAIPYLSSILSIYPPSCNRILQSLLYAIPAPMEQLLPGVSR